VLLGALMSSASWAADMAAGSSWQGGYVGVVGGYGTGKDNAVGGFGGPDVQTEPDGWIAGGHIGFNWAYGNAAVVGLEASIAATGMEGSGTGNYPVPPASIGTGDVTQTLDKYGLFRARVGADLGPVLPYLTGGVAFGTATRSAEANPPCNTPSPPSCSGKDSKTFTGWTAGGGVEIAMGGHWSVRGDYAYIDFGKQNFKIPGADGGSDVHLTTSAITGSVNYRW
jgi:outer membrane immunogenic protein